MNLQLYKYTCLCGHVFKAPHLMEETYGEFLLRSESDELIYLDAVNSNAFNELSELLNNNSQLKKRKDIDKSDIVQNIFSLVCDLSSQGNIYQIQKFPNCLQCGSSRMDCWSSIYPYEIVEMEVNSPTFFDWDRLTKEQKRDMIDKTLNIAIDKVEAYNVYLESLDRSWLKLSRNERIFKMNFIAEPVIKKSKEFLRKIHDLKKLEKVWLSPSSP